MQKQDKEKRSLIHHSTSRIRFSQIVIVVLLTIVIIAAVVIALSKGWERNDTVKQNRAETFTEIFSDTADTGENLLDEFRSIISEFKNIGTSETERLEVEIEAVASSLQESKESVSYINYDWGVLFKLPQGWSYDRSKRAFVSKDDILFLERAAVFNIPDDWTEYEQATPTTLRSYSRDDDEGVVTDYYIEERGEVSYIFSTTDKVGLTADQLSIIASLKTL